MIVLDAAVLIAALDEAHPHHNLAAEVILTDDELVIHTLTLAEVFVGAMRDDEVDEVRQLLQDADIRELRKEDGEAVALARVRESSGLKMPDSCVLFAAESQNAALATFDRTLQQRAEKRGVAVLNLGSSDHS